MVQLLAKKENPGLELNFSHNADIPSTNPATAPYACHGVFTDRSIFSLSLSRSQIPTGTAVTDCNHKHGLMSTCRHAEMNTSRLPCTNSTYKHQT